MKNMKMRNIAAAIICLAAMPVAFGGFEIYQSDTSPKSSAETTDLRDAAPSQAATPQYTPPLTIITDAEEAARLRMEFKRLSAELADVKSQLATAQSDKATWRETVKEANQKLDLCQARIEKIAVSFVFGSKDFHPHPDIADRIINAATLAKTVNIHGYTDNVGTLSANQRLAFERAVAAETYLIGRGVDKVKIKTSGHAGKYIATNATEAGRLANRRVEFDFKP